MWFCYEALWWTWAQHPKEQKWFYECFLRPQSLVPSFDITLPLKDTASVCFNKFGSILSCSIIVYCFSLINSVMSWFWDWILVKHCQNNKVSDLLTLQLGRKSFDVKNYSNILKKVKVTKMIIIAIKITILIYFKMQFILVNFQQLLFLVFKKYYYCILNTED